MKPRITPNYRPALCGLVFALLAMPTGAWAQEAKSADKNTKKEAEKTSIVDNEVSIGVYYLGDDATRYGKYNGLTDQDFALLADLRLEKRPVWDSGDTVRWRLQGWRLGLDSRRLEFTYNDQGTDKLRFDYREIPNNRFSDGLTPYREQTPGLWNLAPGWDVAPGSSNTLGFRSLQESLVDLKVDTKRRRMDLSYERKLSQSWRLSVDWKHEKKEGTRTLGSIFGFAQSNPRSVILPAPVDWTTDIFEAMFEYANDRVQFGFGGYASLFNNGEDTFTFQNAYGYRNGWAPGVEYPDAFGRLALEPDNSYVQFKAYGAMNFTPGTRLTADVAYGSMKQNEVLLPYTVNPDLIVHTPVPLTSLDAKVNTTMVNLRLTSQLSGPVGMSVSYRFDDRDNKTPRAVYPYIGADSQNQKSYTDGVINLPYSYTRQKADALLNFRFARAARFKAGLEYSDYSRDFQEVTDSNELTWLAGLSMRGFSKGSLSLDYRTSTRDVSGYVGNAPLINSRLPGSVAEDEYENNPLLRKYFLTDRDRDEYRFRADFAPTEVVNLGFSASHAEDDYGRGYFGLNNAKVQSWTVDVGYYPRESISLTGFYTNEEYDAEQSARSFFSLASAQDPANDWAASTEDDVETWNVALTFSDIGADNGRKGIDFGFDYTVSDARSNIDVTATTRNTVPLPQLQAKMQTFTLWGSARIGAQSSIRLAAENTELVTHDWALDGVAPDTLANVLLLGESAANYDFWLISGSWTYQF